MTLKLQEKKYKLKIIIQTKKTKQNKLSVYLDIVQPNEL